MNSGLEKIVFSDNRVEKWLHVNPAVFISVKFQKGRGTKKMSEL